MSAQSEAGTRNRPAVTQPEPHSIPHLITSPGAMPSCSLWGNLELGGRLKDFFYVPHKKNHLVWLSKALNNNLSLPQDGPTVTPSSLVKFGPFTMGPGKEWEQVAVE